MNSLRQRAHAFEDKFMHDEELMFKAQARRNGLVGLWAAAIMGRADADAYAKDLIAADITEKDGVFARLRRDFDAAGVTVLDDEIRQRMTTLLQDAAQSMYEGR